LAALVLLDYTLYLWHVATHRAPALWRFHAVHHADLDLDVSTALRFHFGELILSVPSRAAQILLIGVLAARLLSLADAAVPLDLFSSLEFAPARADRARLARLVVTPSMHCIHHSRVPEEADSNWSSGLTSGQITRHFPLDVPQGEIVVGLPELREPEKLVSRKSSRCPLRKAEKNR
jgi:sterol desaturase/sphingolipid hydroxylase (fatty acid hydroxylase superfamily)